MTLLININLVVFSILSCHIISVFFQHLAECNGVVCNKRAKCINGRCVCKRGYYGDGINSCKSKYVIMKKFRITNPCHWFSHKICRYMYIKG